MGKPAYSCPASAIVCAVAARFSLEPALLRARASRREVSTARHLAMYLMRELNASSYSRIALYFRRDQTTVWYAYRRVAADPDLCRVVEEIRARLSGAA